MTIFAARNNVTNEPILLVYGEKGYYPSTEKAYAAYMANQSPEVTEAALIGSMFGWDVPGAAAARKFAEAK